MFYRSLKAILCNHICTQILSQFHFADCIDKSRFCTTSVFDARVQIPFLTFRRIVRIPPRVDDLRTTFSESSNPVMDDLMLFSSRISAISLARNNGSLIVHFITISVCKSFALNAFTISIIRRAVIYYKCMCITGE